MKNFKIVGLLFITFLFFSTSSFGQRNKDVDDALNDSSKLKGLHVGSYVGFSYNNGWIVDFSPGVGYKIKDWLILGAGLNYSYSSTFDYFQRGDKLSSTTIGPRAFAKVNVFDAFYGVAEYSLSNYSLKYKDSQGNVNTNLVQFCKDCDPSNINCNNDCLNKTESALFLGGGYSSSFGDGLGFYTEFIIDVLYDRIHSPRSSPYTVRVGVFYTFR